MEKIVLGRVDVLGTFAIEDTRPEGDRAAAAIADRENRAVAEKRVDAAILGLAQQPDRQQIRLAAVFRQQGRAQGLPIAGRIAEAEGGYGFIAKPAPVQVIQRLPPRRRPQLGLEKLGGGLQHLVQGFLLGIALALELGRLRHLHASLAGQRLHRLHERQVIVPHDEADAIAMRAAAETMEKPLLVVDVKRGCFFLVKRARRPPLPPRPLQLNLPPDERRQRHAQPEFIEELGGEGHGWMLGDGGGNG